MRFNPFADEDELKLLQGSVGVLPQDSSVLCPVPNEPSREEAFT